MNSFLDLKFTKKDIHKNLTFEYLMVTFLRKVLSQTRLACIKNFFVIIRICIFDNNQLLIASWLA